MQETNLIIKNYKRIIIISLLCIPIGIIIGCTETIFGKVILLITKFRAQYYLYLIPFLAIAGCLIVYAYEKFGKEASKGMGLIFDTEQKDHRSIPFRLIPFGMLSTWVTHLFGGSAGKEGVAVQIGGAIAYKLAKRFNIKSSYKTFLIAGMAAGFAGLFRTPIAAVLFACEVIYSGEIIYEALIPSIVCAYSACYVSGLLGLEKETYVISSSINLTYVNVTKLIILGIVFGIVGALFAYFMHHGKKFLKTKISSPYKRVVIIGIIISIITIVLHAGRYAGSGANLIEESLVGGNIYAYDWLIKFILTILTLSAGFQGGEVTPLFSIGASLGALLAKLIGLPIELCAALGYCAVFSSGTNTYLAALMIGGEIFGYVYLPYFFIVCSIAFVFNNNQSIYSKQKIVDALVNTN